MLEEVGRGHRVQPRHVAPRAAHREGLAGTRLAVREDRRRGRAASDEAVNGGSAMVTRPTTAGACSALRRVTRPHVQAFIWNASALNGNGRKWERAEAGMRSDGRLVLEQVGDEVLYATVVPTPVMAQVTS